MPAYALRTTGYFFLCAGVLTALGSFLQVNPVWLYGPYHAWDATTTAQPDWYMGWLEGAVRLMPAWDIQVGGFLLPAIFWPAVVLPGLVFTPLFVWPWLDALATRDDGFHNVLTLPGRAPRPHGRWGRASSPSSPCCSWPAATTCSRCAYGLSQPILLHALQVLVVVLPPAVAGLTYAVARARATVTATASRRWTAPLRASWSATAAARITARYGPEALKSAQAAAGDSAPRKAQRQDPEDSGRGQQGRRRVDEAEEPRRRER